MYWLGLNCESQLIVKCQFAIVRMQKCIASSAHDWFRLHLLSLSTAIHEPSLVLEDHAQAGEITKATLLRLLDIYMYVCTCTCRGLYHCAETIMWSEKQAGQSATAVSTQSDGNCRCEEWFTVSVV